MKENYTFLAFSFPKSLIFQPFCFRKVVNLSTFKLSESRISSFNFPLSCFPAFHFQGSIINFLLSTFMLSCFPLSSFLTLLLYLNPDVRADEPVDATIYIKDHFRAVLSCFPLSSFPTLLLYLNPDVRADEPVDATIYIKDHFRAVLPCFLLSSFPTLLLYLNPDVRADKSVVCHYKY